MKSLATALVIIFAIFCYFLFIKLQEIIASKQRITTHLLIINY